MKICGRYSGSKRRSCNHNLFAQYREHLQVFILYSQSYNLRFHSCLLFQILGLTSICLIISPYSSRLHTSTGRAGFVYSALSGAVLVDLLIVVSHFLQQKIPKKPVSPSSSPIITIVRTKFEYTGAQQTYFRDIFFRLRIIIIIICT